MPYHNIHVDHVIRIIRTTQKPCSYHIFIAHNYNTLLKALGTLFDCAAAGFYQAAQEITKILTLQAICLIL